MLAIFRRLRGKQPLPSPVVATAEQQPSLELTKTDEWDADGLPMGSARSRSRSPRRCGSPPPPRDALASGRRHLNMSPPRRSTGGGTAGPLPRRLSFSPRRSVGAAGAGRPSTGQRRSTGPAQDRRKSRFPASRKSYVHKDFANPHAETCWLSCLFQSLWHSIIFHQTFERDLVPAKYEPKPEERILAALQRTWAEYAAAETSRAVAAAAAAAATVASATASTPAAPAPSTPPETAQADAATKVPEPLVPSEDLAEGFLTLADDQGYGDMSEALACIKQELSASSNPAAVRASELLAIVPVAPDAESESESEPEAEAGGGGAGASREGPWPTPLKAWRQAEEWQVGASPLLAIDLNVPELLPEGCEYLAELWVPRVPAAGGGGVPAATNGGGGVDRSLVSLVCYMWNCRHYVAFCARQGDRSRCIFFNDLPSLTPGAPREVAWIEVPALCRRYCLGPRLAFFESTAVISALGGCPAAAGGGGDI